MWNERHVQLLNAVKTSQVGLGLLSGCAKVSKEKVGGARLTGPNWPSFYVGSSSATCWLSPASTGWRARPETCSTSSLRSPISLREHYPKQVESPCLAPKSIPNCLRTSGRSIIGSTAWTRRKSNSLRRERFSLTLRSSITSILAEKWPEAQAELVAQRTRLQVTGRGRNYPPRQGIFSAAPGRRGFQRWCHQPTDDERRPQLIASRVTSNVAWGRDPGLPRACLNWSS